MRGRFTYLAAVVAGAGVLLLAGPAVASRQAHATAATNVACGGTITASITINGDLDCSSTSSPALTIDQPGVTLDLGGHTITGNSGYPVVVADDTCAYGGQCNNETVTNGTITGGEYQVEFWGQNDTASNLTLTDAASTGVYLHYTTNALVTGNTITGAGSEGIYSEYGSSNVISSNVLKDDSYNLELEYDQADTVSSNNSSISGDDTSSYNFYDYQSDLNTYTNNVTAGGRYGYYIDPGEDGSVTMTGNGARAAKHTSSETGSGFYIYEAYHWSYAAPYSVFSGNVATGNYIGYYDYYSAYALWLENTANYSGNIGFWFEEPSREQIIGNVSKYNGDSGFYLEDTYEGDNALAFANNQAWYNQDYGFYADYSQAGSNNTGSNTNSPLDCYDVSGCS